MSYSCYWAIFHMPVSLFKHEIGEESSTKITQNCNWNGDQKKLLANRMHFKWQFCIIFSEIIFFMIDLVRRYVLGCYRSEQCGLLNSDLGIRCTQAFVETLEKVKSSNFVFFVLHCSNNLLSKFTFCGCPLNYMANKNL